MMWPQQQLTLSLLVPLLPLLPLLRLLLPDLLVLPPPGVRRLLPRAVRHQVPDLPARAAPAVIGRGSVRQKLSVEKVILGQSVVENANGNNSKKYLDGVVTVKSVTDWSSKQVPGIYKRLLDVQIH